jgi:hypothetical protein
MADRRDETIENDQIEQACVEPHRLLEPSQEL